MGLNRRGDDRRIGLLKQIHFDNAKGGLTAGQQMLLWIVDIPAHKAHASGSVGRPCRAGKEMALGWQDKLNI